MTLADRTSIVVGVDGSQTSVEAALWAADLAHRMHVPLVIAHAVTDAAYFYTSAAVMVQYPLGESEREAAKECLDPARDAVSAKYPDLPLSTWSQRAPADLALLALSRKAQMIVVGAHRNVSVDSLLLGSTAARVANHSECPVAVWRGHPGNGPVVVGVDGSPLSALAVERAFEFASAFGTGVRAVHAWAPGVAADLEQEEAEHEALLAESLAGWSEKYPDVPVERIIASVHAELSLPLYAAANARLVVVGSHGRGRASSLLLGSTSRHLIEHCPCPVLVCRSEIHDLA
ncbi:universal stress protein [Smaragdicoccus niigatensis]|uniref:universal stress protein n=1 Tax=Smaragdicoccus niigatensis TaxID=359359 RepID=UPI00037775E3|nr:universal stress protein [Smaragdicoccus niigatensis]